MEIITKEKYNKLLEDWFNNEDIENESYILKIEDRYIAIDNTTNDFWTEEFKKLKEAKKYLGVVENIICKIDT